MHKQQQVMLARRGRQAHARPARGAAWLVVAGALAALALLAAGLWWANLTAGLPSIERLPALLEAGRGMYLQPTRFYDREGQAELYALENPGIPRRYLWVDPANADHFSPLLVQVTLSAADPSFWGHPGSTFASLLRPQPVTLAERLAYAMLLDDEPAGGRRALRARLLALQITRHYGRAQVLEWYLNSASYGHLAYGAESAAQLYLGKSASHLSLGEAALLVAAQQSPALNPLDAPKAALENQRAVLDGLLELGFISQNDYLAARAEPLQLRAGDAPVEPQSAFLRLALAEVSQRFGQERVERGGLRVITTLDANLQQEVDCAARAQLARMAGAAAVPRADGRACEAARLLPPLPPARGELGGETTAGALVLDISSGEVLAYAGGAELSASQPGSLLTPFVALSAFARGLGPASLVWDLPAGEQPAALTAPATFHGPERLRTALLHDDLAPFARLLEQLGPQTTWGQAGLLGLRGLERPAGDLPLLYAGGDVAPLSLAQAYATFAALGRQTGEPAPDGSLKPVLVRAVQALDGTLLQAAPNAQSVNVLAPELAYLVHDVLRDAADPALAPTLALAIDRPAAAKTGQADGGAQAWTVGYTPQRLALAWLRAGDGGAALDPALAAGLWRAVLLTAARDLPPQDWSVPSDVVTRDVCDPSGLLPTADCPNVVSEVFASGSEPQTADTLYRRVQINRETGRLATVFTPPGLVDEQVFLVAPPEARAWVESAGLPQPPEDYDAIQPEAPLADANIQQPRLFASLRGRVEIRGTAAGDDFVSYRVQAGQGLNPRAWLPVGEEQAAPVENGVLAAWDTVGLDGLWALRLQVERSGNRLNTAVIQVTVDNAPPSVRVVYPIQGGTALSSRQGTVTLQVQADDNMGVARVEWRMDGRLVGERFTPPFTLPWAATRGRHTLQVTVEDEAGNRVQSEEIVFETH